MKHETRLLDAEGRVFLYDWGDHYPLLRVSALGGHLRIPTEHPDMVTGDSLPVVSIIVGERGAGTSAFLNWLKRTSSRRWATVDAKTFDFEGLGSCRVPAGEPRGHIFRLNSDDVECSGRLASAIEGEMVSEHNKVIVVPDSPKLETDSLFSSCYSRGIMFRPPHFGVSELAAWTLLLMEKRGEIVANDLAMRCGHIALSCMGGNPLLTHALFSMAESRLSRGLSLDRALEAASIELCENPPEVVRTWKEHLALWCRRQSHRSGWRRCLAGFPMHADEIETEFVELYLAGWLGVFAGDTVAIRSTCHAQWAREVLSRSE